MEVPLTVMSGSNTNKTNGESTATSASAEGNPGRQILVELKNGKVYFRQKPTSFEKQSETLQEIVKFREMLEERIKRQAQPLTTIPDEHRPLIAKLAHESDKALPALSKHIRHELLPTHDEDEDRHEGLSPVLAALPLSAVETAIKAVMERNNYGLDGSGSGKAPAAVCVWRWEVKEDHRDWLPKSGREKADNRLAERVQAKKDLLDIFEKLPQDERDAILDPKGTSKLPSKELNIADPTKPIDLTSEDKSSPQSSKKQQKKKAENEENDTSKKTSTRATKVAKSTDPEKAFKEQEKLEKKAAKAEKEKKEKDAQNKSRSLMANFFAKPKKTPTRNPSKERTAIAGPSSTRSDFDKAFKPFVLKKDTDLAPVNWFLEARKPQASPSSMKMDNGVIVIDVEESFNAMNDVEMKVDTTEINVDSLTSEDHLRSILSSLSVAAGSSRHRLLHKPDPHLKTYSALSVRDIVSQLSEAEIAGDISTVRSLLSIISNRSLLPAKVFIFTEDARPGYFGTWTRSSRIIGPRTPFAKDVLVFDYGYDSGEEWEQETAGDADDVVEDGEDEDADGEDADSDLESWLVDDDEEPEVSLHDPEMSHSDISDAPVLSTKRKAEEGEKKLGKKRKVVIPLIPFARGPCWETSIGHCEYDLLEPYRIRMFNDTPLPIDPFTFVSCVDTRQEPSKPVFTSDGVFAVPSLPIRLINPTGSGSSSPVPAVPGAAKKPSLAPKTTFPEVHLPFLLEKVNSLQAGSINFLVEAIHRDLREHKVKKNTIEAKVREVGEKCKEKKFWILKAGLQVPS